MSKDERFLAGKSLGGVDQRVESRLAVNVKPHKPRVKSSRPAMAM
jgi:hypothetical protein